MSFAHLDLHTIEETLSSHYKRCVRVRPIENDPFKRDIADTTLKFLVSTPQDGAGFMHISGAGNPHLAQRSVNNIDTIRHKVSHQTGEYILPPVLSGDIAGRTFAVWDMNRPFLASNRVMCRIRNYMYARRITRWIHAFCRETKRPAVPEIVLKDLSIIMREEKFPEDIRRAAAQAADRLKDGSWHPQNCFQHGDFWTGNLLLPTTPAAPPFYIIDWAGLECRGYPFLDMARVLMSLRTSQRFNRRCTEEMRQTIGCQKQDIIAYILSACGRIGANLEYFPPHRFRASTRDIYRFARSVE